MLKGTTPGAKPIRFSTLLQICSAIVACCIHVAYSGLNAILKMRGGRYNSRLQGLCNLDPEAQCVMVS